MGCHASTMLFCVKAVSRKAREAQEQAKAKEERTSNYIGHCARSCAVQLDIVAMLVLDHVMSV